MIDFDRTYDHVGYTGQALLNDMDRIKVKVIKEQDDEYIHHDKSAKLDYCQLHDWVTVNYKAFDKGGLEVYNSFADTERPKSFRLGHYEVSKCWDIALQQAKERQYIRVSCPGDLDQGGDTERKADDSAGKFFKDPVDMDYEFDILECSVNPPSL
jgi:hypothetical protein